MQKLSASDPKRPGAAAAACELPLWRWLASRSGSVPQARPFASPEAAARARWKGCRAHAPSQGSLGEQPSYSATALQKVAVHGGRDGIEPLHGIFNQSVYEYVRLDR